MIMIDPPFGWLYGFPKVCPDDRLGNVNEWLVEEGYPKEEIESYGQHFYYRTISVVNGIDYNEKEKVQPSAS
jgi:hypothetical protein